MLIFNRFVLILILFYFLGLVSTASADIYTFEENGVVTITSKHKGNKKVDKKNLKKKKKRKKKKKATSSSGKRGSKKTGLHRLPKRALRFKTFVQDASLYYDLPEALIWGVMKIESSFNPRALSNKGAQGLMQLMPETAKDMGVKDSYDPEQNIYGAARLLRILANRFNGDLVLTLSAYHAGGGAVSKEGGIPYEQTAQYVRKTLNAYYGYMEEAPYISSK